MPRAPCGSRRRCYHGSIGVVVLDADIEEDARTLMKADPSVRSGVQSAELSPFRTFLARERKPQD